MRLLQHDRFVLGHEALHDEPREEVGHGADAEDDHVTCGLAAEPEERERLALGGGIIEQHTGPLVDEERTDTPGHGADACDGGDGRLGEHVADGGKEVGRPSLVPGARDTDDDGGEPDGKTLQRLCEQRQQREESEKSEEDK